MSKEKHIEETAKDICRICRDYTLCEKEFKPCVLAKREAEALYNANYRKQEWISVDERLPEENGRYLVCVDISHLAFENLTIIAVMEYGKDHGFYLYDETETVTHWMPLPEAPKMKGGAK